ncbi:restriction endonuclease subunit S [Xanthomonas vasicola]|nr:restriction endonuclease subunit S [Xanthomonas vasicola]MBV6747836.1 restriction endonuclease subunit S [Xanthomonas vasicola pv. vasculorum NCPPB 890]MBV6893445.1 restriction endonuclease subunit S [Xanthomonas vasicola pv. vasculorum]MDO6949081.1 restriction endonuclease subunit S [Xanthomonas vasicola]MDO6961190.1 restriction endonuclease subunit S [Xanthomonas vasicola]MDO6970056.1 restriction endonuclease subunit S [Xanthomonas vasicola]
MSELPAGWVSASIGEICSQGEQRIPEADEQLTYIDIASVDRGRKTVMGPQLLRGYEAPSRARKVVATGDVIVSMTRPNLNAVALIGQRHDSAIASTGFDVLRPIEVDPRWIFAAVKSAHFVKAMSAKVQGALYPAIKADDIRKHEIPLPPLAEQKRIAQKLDALLAQVDTLKARIDAIPALLKRFRKSVVHSAVIGRLSADLRVPIEKPEEQEQLGPLELWREVALASLGELSRGKSKHRPRNDSRLYGSAYPFIQTGDVANSRGTLTSSKVFYSEFGLKQSRLFPSGTLCITIAANIADTAMLAIDACFPDSVVGFIPNKDDCVAQFIKYVIDDNKESLEALAPATAQKNINLKVLSQVKLRIPPIKEQTEIVRRVEQLFAYADQLEAKVAAAQQRIDALTQSLLAKAFRGELVPQDPSDEPASVLLQRIRTQRAAAPKPKRGRKAAAS